MAKDKWEILGEHFGYPKCCINYFMEYKGALSNPLGASVSNNTGFIPCPTCAKLVLDGDIELKDLIVNRSHSIPFPNNDEVETILYYIKHQNDE